MNEQQLTALAAVLAVIVGMGQVVVMISQKRQTRIALTAEYRKLWNNCKIQWGQIIFIGRDRGEYYQVLSESVVNELKTKTKIYRNDIPTTWALESIQIICGLLGEISTRILQGHLRVSDAYPIFGTEFLRHGRPLRQLLDKGYAPHYLDEGEGEAHRRLRLELQDWLTYHDGLRRRCLILIDLMWAEAARMEDLPPSEMKSAAEAKKATGHMNRQRLYREILRLNGIWRIFLAIRLTYFLRRAEYFSWFNLGGLTKKRIALLEENWTERLLSDR